LVAVATAATAVAASVGLVTQGAGAPAVGQAGPAAQIVQAAPAVPVTPLQQRLDTLLTDPRFQGSMVGLVVRDATTGETLYDRNGAVRQLPASNTKLFTSTAAMEKLGTGFRFHTDVLATAPVRGGLLPGNLYLKGYGDPTALASDYAALAKQVAASGVRWVAGDLVADDTYFDKVRLGDTWAADDESAYYSRRSRPSPSRPTPTTTPVRRSSGVRPARPSGTGEAHDGSGQRRLRLVNTAVTGPAGSANTLAVERDHGTNVVRITGSIPADDTGGQDWVTVWEPTVYAADVFRRALAARRRPGHRPDPDRRRSGGDRPAAGAGRVHDGRRADDPVHEAVEQHARRDAGQDDERRGRWWRHLAQRAGHRDRVRPDRRGGRRDDPALRRLRPVPQGQRDPGQHR
jgi:D-alanyl-D-alanine carboxypeptidase/D-alanyl-D-alanine-endopeptidase (penicillin-binding protein 4)